MLKQIIFWILLSEFSVPVAQAQPAAPRAFSISSDRADYDDVLGRATYSGHVRLKQGLQLLNAEVLHLQRSQDHKLLSMEAEGSPVTFKLQPDASQTVTEGQALKVRYDIPAQRVTLIGEALIHQAHHTIRGPRLIYNIVSQTLMSEQSGEDRTRVIINPKSH